MLDRFISTCGNRSSNLNYTSYLSASSVPEKGIQNSVVVVFVHGRFKAVYGNQTHAN